MPLTFETLDVRAEGAVRVVAVSALPMNLLGPELVRFQMRDAELDLARLIGDLSDH